MRRQVLALTGLTIIAACADQPVSGPQEPAPAFLHDVELKRSKKRGQVKLCILAPERCLIDVNAKNHTLSDAAYFEWCSMTSVNNELRVMRMFIGSL